MTRKVQTQGIGGALMKDRKQKKEAFKNQMSSMQVAGVSESQAKRSVLEQSSLQTFLATAELAKQEFEALRGRAELVDDGPRLIQGFEVDTSDPVALAATEALALKAAVPVPRRPVWDEGMTADELTAVEGENFVNWRRTLAVIEEEHGLVMTPYERNLDFWRQLWRCIERSDLLVQICDSRDPEFYRSKDLEQYVLETPGKQHLLLMNKADFLTAERRLEWKEYFENIGVEVLFFSALRELDKQNTASIKAEAAASIAASSQARADLGELAGGSGAADDDDDDAPDDAQLVRGAKWKAGFAGTADDEDDEGPVAGINDDEDDEAEAEAAVEDKAGEDAEDAGKVAALPPHGQFSDDENVADVAQLLEELCKRIPELKDGRRGTVGFVGYPNVGKSSVINSIFGSKKASMSRTPGKTKHLQTLELMDLGITLCDCPGLVFPSVVASRSHLVINGTVPIDELRDFVAPTTLIVGKVGLDKLLDKYECRSYVQDGISRHGEKTLDPGRTFLSAFAVRRRHFLRVGVPDETWSARRLMKDYCTGELLHCEKPPGAKEKEAAALAAARKARGEAEVDVSEVPVPDSDEDFDDLGEYMAGEAPEGAAKVGTMTKRKTRQLQKMMMKGQIQKGKAVSSSQKGAVVFEGMVGESTRQ